MQENPSHIDLFELAGKKFSGEISDIESDLLQTLLVDEDNLRDFSALEKLWQVDSSVMVPVDVDSALAKVTARIETKIPQQKAIRFRVSRTIWFGAASIVAAIALFFLFPIGNGTTGEPLIAVVADTVKTEIQLDDGTQIALNIGCKIDYPETFGTKSRELYLQGEAFFDVARDTTKPFIVHTKFADIRVLGTSFFVKSHPKSQVVEVSVETGRVEVISSKNGTSVILTPGEAVSYQEGDNDLVVKEAPADNSFWRSRLLRFKREPLDKVVSVVNRWYSPRLVIAPEVEDCLITASFENKTIDDIVAIITGTLDLSANHSSDSIYIYGQACK